ncbi:MAG: histidinol-phosphatase [Clostridia bacterium]|nr:histidinol-phosphatase [Clostridia bacterium]
MFTQNLHAHGQFDDGKSTLEDMLLASKAAGLTSLGFSVHCPLPFGTDWACPQSSLADYIAEVRRLQEKYAGRIELFLGVEWDVTAEDFDLTPFDYAIGSAHHLPCAMKLPENCPPELAKQFAMDYPSVDDSAEATARCLAGHFGGDADAYAKAYFTEVKKAAAKDDARIVGHFDLLTKFDEARGFFSRKTAAYTAAALDAMEALVHADKIFEINTGAISRGHRSEPYPSRELLCVLREMGGKVTISADTHHVSSVACAYDLAESIARECGFTALWRLARVNGQPAFIPEEL